METYDVVIPGGGNAEARDLGGTWNIVIATGSKPRPLSIPGAKFLTTSEDADRSCVGSHRELSETVRAFPTFAAYIRNMG